MSHKPEGNKENSSSYDLMMYLSSEDREEVEMGLKGLRQRAKKKGVQVEEVPFDLTRMYLEPEDTSEEEAEIKGDGDKEPSRSSETERESAAKRWMRSTRTKKKLRYGKLMRRNPRWQKSLNKNLSKYVDDDELFLDERAWTSSEIEDLAELIGKFGCSDESVLRKIFCERLSSRSVEEIQAKISDMLTFMRQADGQLRDSYFNRCDAQEPKIAQPLQNAEDGNWFSAVSRMLQDRGRDVVDITNVVLCEVLEECGEEEEEKRMQTQNTTKSLTPDYQAIYEKISTITALKRPKGPPLPPLESAVVMSIIEEVERNVDQNLTYRMPAYAAMFRDLQQQYYHEFAFCRNVPKFDNVGMAHLNVFGLNPSQVHMYPPKEKDDDREEEEVAEEIDTLLCD